MKQTEHGQLSYPDQKPLTKSSFRILSFVHRSLTICLIVLGLIIIGGTVYGVFFRSVPLGASGNNLSEQTNVSQASGQGQTSTFTGIGRLRIPTADPQPGMVILFVSFLYHPDDRAFAEELALRVGDLREIVRDYIGSFHIAELQRQDEEVIRTELLHRFNTILRLGQIETLFFSDLMMLE